MPHAVSGPNVGLSPAKVIAHVSACHQSIRGALEQLEQAYEICVEKRVDRYDAAAGGLAIAMRVLHTVGEAHELVEEAVLFPLLRAAVPDRENWFDALLAEHGRAQSNWESVLPHLERLHQMLEQGDEPDQAYLANWGSLLALFIGNYRAHMAIEDQEILPLAAHVLDRQDSGSLDRALDSALPHLLGTPVAY